MRSRVRVLHPGLFTTIQDLGRPGYQRFGMPVGGAMDRFAARVANRLVGNPDDAALLEATVTGPSLRFASDAWIAMTGADLSPSLDGKPLPLWTSVDVEAGATLQCGLRLTGARAYLAIAGGIDVPLLFNSRATCVRSRLGGIEGRALKRDDLLVCGTPHVDGFMVNRGLSRDHWPQYRSSLPLRTIRGRHADLFTQQAKDTFLAMEFAVSPQSDRMGYRLTGPPLSHGTYIDEVLSEAMPAGTIQVPPDGQAILLMADRATTGGYRKLATVISADLPRAAQLLPGETVRFAEITVEEAHALLREQMVVIDAIGQKKRGASRRPSL